ncbi:single-stranded DNA-binding protein [Leucobacter weissii]|uniref:Single-stranded DNA-binding protein n=1 Tax=Leucobacter weissii TaxID=1983706 RepID=A0A939MNQ1_9MICO|nr:single-stranded DNA-binding protein [Leucobacter weissii]MBO1903195.1 single-stranded DNA-binding protein [Leucobacter weissii]
MSFITFTGNLAKTPELRTDKNNRPYTFARVIRTDRVRNSSGEFEDGGTEGYDVAVWGADAEALCELAERCGNIRVTVSGEELLEVYTPEGGEPRIVRKVLDADVSVSLRGQTVTVEKRS